MAAEFEKFVQGACAEWKLFGVPWISTNSSRSVHDDVEIHISRRVLGVVQIQQGTPLTIPALTAAT